MKTIRVTAIPAAGPYAQAVAAGGLIFTSGQLPVDPATGTMPATIEAQTAQAIRNLETVLTAAGSCLSRVVKTTCYLQNMADFAAFNAVYASFFQGETPPARSCTAAAALPKGALVEIEAVAE